MRVTPLTPEAKARVEGVLSRALNDIQFREKLLANPAEALKDTDLTAEERNVVGTLKRVQLEEWGVDVRDYRALLMDNGFKIGAG